MKAKNIFLLIAIIICSALCIFLFLTNVLGLNIVRHHTMQLDGFTLKFYGSFSEVTTLKIYDGAIRRATLDFSADPDIFSDPSKYQPYLEDLNSDGHPDIIVPHSKDHTDSTRYAAFLWDNEAKMFTDTGVLNDIANIKINKDDHSLTSYMVLHTTIYEEQLNIPEMYEERQILKEFKIIADKYTLFREYSLIYYSESDIYCYSKYDYDAENGELICTSESWLTAEQATKIELS